MSRAESLLSDRQDVLFARLREAGLDALALNAGQNLAYLTGLSFHRMERPTLVLFAPGRPIAIVIPAFEAGKTQDLPYSFRVFPYEDHPGKWLGAVQQAVDFLGLQEAEIGVESRELRVFEERLLRAAAPGANFPAADPVVAGMRLCKDPDEISKMQKAVDIAQAAFLAMLPQVKAGMTEQQVAAELTLQLLRAGSEPELPFQPIVASGPNGANPHAVPSERRLEKGDLVVVDWGAGYQGYISDLTRTLAVGPYAPEAHRIAEITIASVEAGCSAVRPGIAAGEVDRAAREVIARAGYGADFRNRVGHGIGREVHEEPYIFGDNPEILQPGMTFTVEPGIYLDGRMGVRVEENVVVTAGGAAILSSLPRQLFELTI